MLVDGLKCFNHVSIVYLGEDNPTETTIPVQICMHWKHQSDYIYTSYAAQVQEYFVLDPKFTRVCGEIHCYMDTIIALYALSSYHIA